jgi:hypothetical protein
MVSCREPLPVRLQDIITRKGAYVSVKAMAARDALYSVRSIVEEPACAPLSDILEHDYFIMYRCIAFSAHGEGEVVELQIEIYRVEHDDLHEPPLYVMRIAPLNSTHTDNPLEERTKGFENIVMRLKHCLRNQF